MDDKAKQALDFTKVEAGEAFSVTIQFLNGLYSINNATVQELYFMEDIFSPFITGKLTFMDTIGIIEKGPITGNETLTIQYTGTGEGHSQIKRTFSIFKISEISSVTSTDPNNIVAEIYFVDAFYVDMGIKQYSRSWKKEFGHNIIKHIVTKIANIEDKFLNMENEAWEECNEEFEYFYMPYWTCIDSIKWLLRRMSSKKMETSGYLFFANGFDSTNPERDGMSTLNLTTLDTLLAKRDFMKTKDDDNSIYTFTDDEVGMPENRILTFTMDSIDKNSLKGIAGAHYYGFDSKAKKAVDVPITYKDMIEKHTILGNVSLFTDISEADAGRYFTGEDDEKIINNIAYSDWVKRYVMQQYMVVVTQGHEKRYAGGLIKLKFPTRFFGQTPGNMMLSGNYLVKTITHYFSPQDAISYRQKMVLIKNGYDDEIKELVPSSKKNIDAKSIFGGKG